MKHCFLILLLCTCVSAQMMAQDCDCPYPVVFVHGWNGGETSWETMAQEWAEVYGDDYVIPDMSAANPEGTVYYAHLNYQYGSSVMFGADGSPDGATYSDDDVVLHHQFGNAPVLSPNKCAYSVSFKLRRDNIFTTPVLVSESHPSWDVASAELPAGESDSNESSVIKQGYALGKAIEAILTATGKDKVVLVTHSMGGLAAREYLQRSYDGGNTHTWWVDPNASDGHKVAKLLTVSTPHGGSNRGSADFVGFVPSNFINDMDEKSEAVRDLRTSYGNSGVIARKAGVYLYGGNEDADNDSPFTNFQAISVWDTYHDYDVSCDGAPNDTLSFNISDVEALNFNQVSPHWDSVYANPLMPLPTEGIKYSYYVGNLVLGGGDGVVDDQRQWLWNGGNGSAGDYASGQSVPHPFLTDAHVAADRITSPLTIFHTNSPDEFYGVSRGMDEGDYAYYAAKITPGDWYRGIAQERADKVPLNSESTTSGNRLTDSDWYKVDFAGTSGKIIIDYEKPTGINSRIDVYTEMPDDFDNINGPVSEFIDTEGEESYTFSDLCTVNGTLYFRITNFLGPGNVGQQEFNDYKFRVSEAPPRFTDSCPVAPDCDYTFSGYGTGCGNSDYDCSDRYNGEFGNIRVPTRVLYLGTQLSATSTQVSNLLTGMNGFFQAPGNNLNWDFYISGGQVMNTPDFNNFSSLQQGDPAFSTLQAEIDAHPDELSLIIVDDAGAAGRAGYPFGEPIATINGSQWMIIDQEHIINESWAVVAHELGHLFGLFHTFECDAFPDYLSCSVGCRSGDGIGDTPLDYGAWNENDGAANLMDYDNRTFDENITPFVELSSCQAAKMNDLLFNCRNNLGRELEIPELTDRNTGILAPQLFNTFYRDPLDTLVVTLQGNHYSNDEGYAHWTFIKPNGSTFELWADTLDLNTLYTQGKIDRPGNYGVEVRDRRIYNEDQQSAPLTFLLELGACNFNTICEQWETTTGCSDCEFGTNNFVLQGMEYYLDDDPGYGLGTTVPGVSGNNAEVDFNVDLSNVSPGIHTLYVRAQDDQGNWSFTQRRLFYVYDAPGGGSNTLTRLEYFLDTDPGYGQGIALPLADVEDSQDDYQIDLSGVSPGIHTLYVRAENNAGRWSFTQRRLFYVFDAPGGNGTAELDYLEYFLDDDPGYALGTALTLADTEESQADYTIDLSTVSPGIHTLFVRARDTNGRWSFIQRRLFYVFDAPGGTTNELDYLEYFLDDDPGYGAGTSLPLADVQDSQADYNIDLTSVNPGIHTLFVRARDTRGRWSFVQRRLFYVFDAPGGPREIVEVEYFIDGPGPDYGLANQLPITPDDSIDVDFTVPTAGLTGNHILYVRAKDNYGRWSFTVSDTLVWSDLAIDVISPNGGQTYTAGVDAISNIQWDTTGNVGDVDIWLIKPNGLHIAQIANGVDQAGPFAGPWPIPVWVNAGEYRIKVNAESEPTILGYSTNTFRINSPNGTFCDGFTDLVAASETRDAATCLCEKGMVIPKYYESGNTYGVNAAANLERADLAKLTYLLVHGSAYSSPAADFPVPYADLQTDDAEYFLYARDLLYLQYDDEVTPYDRDFINFRPFDSIQSRYALKVILEAMDVAPDNSGPSPYPNIGPGDDAYGYVKAAHNQGWLPANFDAYAGLVRGTAFVIFKNIIDDETNLDCTAATAAKLGVVTLDDYAVPGNFTPMNQSRTVDMAEGYFPSFFKSSFKFPGIGLPLTFGHGYYAHHTEQPERFRPLSPLGRAWTHSFNSYIIEEQGWSTTQASFADKVYVNWGNGTLHCYDKATRAPESHGVFSTLIRQGETRYIIRSKAQIEYGFTRFVLDADRLVWMMTDITDRNGNTVTISIDDSGARPRVQSVVGSGGYTLMFGYDGDGNLSSVTDVAGSRVITYVVDANENLVSFSNAKGDETTFGYGTEPEKHLLYTVDLPEGNGITNTYRTDGRLETTKINGQTNATQIAAAYDYTQTATPVVSTVTDTEGDVTTKAYNDDGYLSQYDQDGDDLTVVYNANYPSLPASVTSNGTTVGTSYDAKGNPLTITLPLGVTHRYTYNSFNDPLTYVTPRNKTTTFSYDGNGNLDDVTDPNGNKTDLRFNGAGQLLWIKSPENVQFTNTYNTDGTLAGTSGPEGLYQNFDYDAVGRRVFAENANGQVTTFAHDALDQMVRMTRKGETTPEDIVTRYGFNANMLMDSIINAKGNATTFDYNDQNQPTKVQFGDDADLIDYDEEGKVDFTTVPTGDVLDRIYDDRDRMTFNGYATITYDDRDNLETFTHAGRTTTITYDDLDRPKTAMYDGKTIAYGYDANGNTTSTTYADGTVITKTYDNADRLLQVKLGSTVLVNHTYRKDNLPDRITYGNGTYCDHVYDDAARLTGKSWHKSDGTVICSYDITLDGVGNHLNVNTVEPFGTPALLSAMYTASYNNENEPTTVDGQTFTFNALGTQTSAGGTPYVWNEHEQLLTVGNDLTYQYDGQKLRRLRVAPDGLWTYDWDVRGIGNILTDYLDGTARYHYVYGAGLTCRIDVATGDVQYFHGDVRGSVIAITDAGQNLTHQYQYDPFGIVLQRLEADYNPFQYVGQYGLMQEGGDLYYVRARYMDAKQGRFISEDPVWHDNLFPYAGNNPLAYIDINGGQYSKPNDYTDQSVIGNSSFVPVDQALNMLTTTIDWSAYWSVIKEAASDMLGINSSDGSEAEIVVPEEEVTTVPEPSNESQFAKHRAVVDEIEIHKETYLYFKYLMLDAYKEGDREKAIKYSLLRTQLQQKIDALTIKAEEIRPRL